MNPPLEKTKETEFYEKVHETLVKEGGANPQDQEQFLHHMTAGDRRPEEYRFQGSFGFGGKYRPTTNTIDCYPEDITPEREQQMISINHLLAGIKK